MKHILSYRRGLPGLIILGLVFMGPLLYSQQDVVVSKLHKVAVPDSYRKLISDKHWSKVLKISEEGRTKVVNRTNDRTLHEGEQYLIVPRADTIERTTSTILQLDDDVGVLSAGPVEAYEIPEDYIARVTNATVTSVRPLFRPRSNLQYDPVTKLFSGSLMIILEDSLTPERSQKLTSPIAFEIVSPSAKVQPTRFSIDHTNLPPTDVELSVSNPDQTVEISLITTNKPSGYDAHIPVDPAVIIESEGRSIQGLGVQSIPITLVLRGAGEDDVIPVQVQTTSGSIEPSRVRLTSTSPQSVRLRSEGLGIARVEAVSTSSNSATVEFHYAFPWRFLLFALLGGILGSSVWFLRKKLRGQTSIFPYVLLGGVFWGLLATTLYLFGVNVTGINIKLPTIFNEIIVFGFAGLASASWIPNMNRSKKS